MFLFGCLLEVSCADPERFVRGGPTFKFNKKCLVDEGRENRNTTLSRRFVGVPMMAKH